MNQLLTYYGTKWYFCISLFKRTCLKKFTIIIGDGNYTRGIGHANIFFHEFEYAMDDRKLEIMKCNFNRLFQIQFIRNVTVFKETSPTSGFTP
jgi:hypothetical protein